ncbi:hypothetical protein DWC31_23345 [Salmonella enterica]|nr:hypothetical protein [Salmonella enterica]
MAFFQRAAGPQAQSWRSQLLSAPFAFRLRDAGAAGAALFQRQKEKWKKLSRMGVWELQCNLWRLQCNLW